MADKKLYPWQTPEGKVEFNKRDGLDVYDEDYRQAQSYSDRGTLSYETEANLYLAQKAREEKQAKVKADSLAVDTEEKTKTATTKKTKPTEYVRVAARRVAYTADGRQIDLPMPNKLKGYASYNYRISMFALTDEEINNPDETYRKRDPQVAIMRSGGGLGDRKVTTAYEINGKKVEFFINNLAIESVIAPNRKKSGTNATGFTLEVLEPYSMGLFLQALQIGALQAGHKNYLESPFLLKIDFVGWDDDGNRYVVPSAKKLLPFKLSGSDLQVTEGGSSYQVSGYPFNEAALTDIVQRLPVDVSISGRTLEQLLQSGPLSLMTEVNKYHAKRALENKVLTADQYFVVFPIQRASKGKLTKSSGDGQGATTQSNQDGTIQSSTNSGGFNYSVEEKQKLWNAIQKGELSTEASVYLEQRLMTSVTKTTLGQDILEKQTGEKNSNSIGTQNVFDPNAVGVTNQPFGLAGFAWDKNDKVWKRGGSQLQIDPSIGQLKFLKGAKIQDVIQELVLISDWGKQLVDATPDENGMKDWFKIDTQVFQISDNDTEAQYGRKPRIYVYRVLPYKVHEARFVQPSKNSYGIEALRKQVCKSYDYIYSGANDDIIDLQINLDTTFFKSISPGNLPKTSGQDALKSAEEKNDAIETDEGDATTVMSNPGIRAVDNQITTSMTAGAVNPDDFKIEIARSFNEAIVNSDVDLLTVDMTIWGDPYYIADSGMGNYNSENSLLINVDANGNVDYQQGEVDIELNFRTPIDIRDNGIMGFPSDQVAVNQFSGLYQVINVLNNFQDGQFKQTLSLVRRSNQHPKLESDQSDKKSTEIKADQGDPF